jgi:hypothetical protein
LVQQTDRQTAGPAPRCFTWPAMGRSRVLDRALASLQKTQRQGVCVRFLLPFFLLLSTSSCHCFFCHCRSWPASLTGVAPPPYWSAPVLHWRRAGGPIGHTVLCLPTRKHIAPNNSMLTLVCQKARKERHFFGTFLSPATVVEVS